MTQREAAAVTASRPRGSAAAHGHGPALVLNRIPAAAPLLFMAGYNTIIFLILLLEIAAAQDA